MSKIKYPVKNIIPIPPTIYTTIDTFDDTYQKVYYFAGMGQKKWCSIEEFMALSLRCAGIENIMIHNKSDLINICKFNFGEEWASFCL
jgi:hypothetical protein